MEPIENYLAHNVKLGIIKEWYWDDDFLLDCVFKRHDEIEDCLDGLVMTIVNTLKFIVQPIQVVLSQDIGEYLDVFYGVLDITFQQDNIVCIKRTDANHKEKMFHLQI